MHNSFNITEEERRRILSIHENATKNSYLKIITEAAEDPRVATAEEIKNDAKGDFSACTCVTKMGWKRGIDTGNNVYYLNPNNNLGYFPPSEANPIKGCRIYKNPPDYNDFVKNFNCKQRPFVKPAQKLDDLTSSGSTLQLGDKSPAVQLIQQFLKDIGKLPETFTTSEKFDKETQKAVIAFQKEKKLRVDGVVGKNTARALMVANTATIEKKPIDLSAELKKYNTSDTDLKLQPNKDEKSGGLMGGVVDFMKQELEKSSYNMPEF